MSTIVTRQGKGAPLTNSELDANFTNLNTDKLEAGALAPYLTSAIAGATYHPLLGYTPANKAGDTFSGNVIVNAGTDSRTLLQVSGVTQAQLQATASAIRLASNNTTPLVLATNGVDRVTFDSNGNVTFGATGASGAYTFRGLNTGDLVVFESTDASATAAPDVVLYRNSASPAANDQLGVLVWRGKDSGAADQQYARIGAEIIDPTAGSEDADLWFETTVAGAAVERIRLNAAGLSLASGTGLTLNAGTANGVAYLNGSKVLTSGTALTFDGSNLGLGVTPSVWGSTYKAIEIAGANAGVISATVNNLNFGTNLRNDNTNWIYTYTGQNATRYEMHSSGQHRWYTAPSGTANSASITTGIVYIVAGLGSSTLAQWQAFFSALTVLPTVGESITATATGTLVGGGTVTQTITFTQAMTLSAAGALNTVGAITQNGSQVLTAGNYTSYAISASAKGAANGVAALDSGGLLPLAQLPAKAVYLDVLPSIRPTLLLDFANTRRLDPRITFTRASTATYHDQFGVLKTAASGVPRFNHNPTTLQSLGLMNEGQRTNLCTSSEVLSAGSNATITNDVALSPMGTMTADLLTENTANTEHYASNETISFTAGTTYASTAYIKNPSTDVSAFFYLRAVSPVASAYVFVRTSDMTIQTSAGVNIVSSSIQQVNDGYWRVSMIWTAASTGSASVRTGLAPSVTLGSYVGTGKQMLVACRQTEVGTTSSSYIPTVSSQVTRAADAAVMTGANFSSWFKADEGTFYLDADMYETQHGFFRHLLAANNASGSVADFIGFSVPASGNNLASRVTAGGTTSASMQSAITLGTAFRAGFAYKTNGSAVSYNGVAALTDNSVTLPVGINRLYIGSADDSGTNTNSSTHIRKIAYYPLRVADAQLQALTS